MMNAFVLSTAIAWGGANAGQVVYDNPEREALKALGKACYVELGLDVVAKRAEKKYVPQIVKEYGVWPTLVIKVVTEKRLSYEWTF